MSGQILDGGRGEPLRGAYSRLDDRMGGNARSDLRIADDAVRSVRGGGFTGP
jgi:hypothetical protein